MPAKEIIENTIKSGIDLCVVTKNHSIEEVKKLLSENPQLKAIGENRWPDCEEKFGHFTNLERHFIGSLQGNKVKKVLPIVDMIQSVDSMKLFRKIDSVAGEIGKPMKVLLQVNISNDPAKHGIKADEIDDVIKEYLSAKFTHLKLQGFMTMGEITNTDSRKKYYSELKKLLEDANEKYFSNAPLTILSMGTSDDYKIAIESGATMVRVGRGIFAK